MHFHTLLLFVNLINYFAAKGFFCIFSYFKTTSRKGQSVLQVGLFSALTLKYLPCLAVPGANIMQ